MHLWLFFSSNVHSSVIARAGQLREFQYIINSATKNVKANTNITFINLSMNHLELQLCHEYCAFILHAFQVYKLDISTM